MAMESAGTRLRSLRLEKGLTLEQVHKGTKIHLNVLKAIEEDSLINFNPVYIKGFLRIYCKFLGADPKDYIADYKEVRSLNTAREGGAKKKFSHRLKTSSGVFGALRALQRQKKKIFAACGIIIFIFLVFNLGKLISARKAHAPARMNPAQEKSLKQERKQGKEEASSMIRLAIRAREGCFVQLKSDGKTIFYGTIAKGRTESWHARNKMELSLGNAGVVDLEVNGKPISNLGKKGQSLKNIVISREGLEIGR